MQERLKILYGRLKMVIRSSLENIKGYLSKFVVQQAKSTRPSSLNLDIKQYKLWTGGKSKETYSA